MKWQTGDLEVLREVFYGFSEEVRIRGFPSQPLGRFGFIVSGFHKTYRGFMVMSNLMGSIIIATAG